MKILAQPQSVARPSPCGRFFYRSALKYTLSFLTCNVKVEQNSSPYVTLISITCRATRECECPYVTLRSTYVTLSDQCESALRALAIEWKCYMYMYTIVGAYIGRASVYGTM